MIAPQVFGETATATCRSLSEKIGEDSTDWYVVQTKPSRENRVASCLSSLNLEVLLPKVKWRRSRNRITKKAFFSNYLFTKITSGSTEMNLVQYCQGVVRVVSSRGLPIPVENEIIWSIRSMMDEHGFIQLKAEPLRPGGPIRINEGYLSGWSGKIERELDGGKRVAILLDTILNARVIVERCQVLVNAETWH